MRLKRDGQGFVRRFALGAIVAALGALVVPAAASAVVTVSATTSPQQTITIQADPGGANNLSITPGGGADEFDIDGVFPTDAMVSTDLVNCPVFGAVNVTCTIPGLDFITVNLDDQGDTLNSSTVPISTIVDAGPGVDNVTTGAGNDDMGGGAGNDVDTLTGGAGFDNLDGGPGADVMSGGADFDTHTYEDNTSGVTVTLGDATANDGGTEDGNADSLTGIENLIGSDFDDDLTGDGSDNEFTGGDGADLLDGEGGFDINSYSGRPTAVTADLDAASGDDGGTPDGVLGSRDSAEDFEGLIGGEEDDTLTGDDVDAVGTDVDNFIQGNGGNDTINGGGGNDLLDGGGDNDLIDAGAGDDTLPGVFGFGGNDAISGGSGNDSISAGDDDDSAAGGTGNDTIEGGEGANEGTIGGLTGLDGGADNDLIKGGSDSDEMIGGTGTDRVSYEDSSSDVNVNLATETATGQGFDSLSGFEDITGSINGLDELTGDAGSNAIDGLAGNNEFSGLGGNDTFTGGADDDTVLYTTETATTANVATGGSNTDGVDTYAGTIENLVGSSGNDNFTGNGSVNDLTGNGGNDSLTAAGGADALFGNAGNDTLLPGAGIDNADGGTDDDTVSYVDSSTRIFLNLSGTVTPPAGGSVDPDTVEEVDPGTEDDVPNVENAIGSDVNSLDILTGDSTANNLDGRVGDDRFFGGDGNDQIIGGPGPDNLNGEGGNDTLEGNGDNDTFSGGDDTDTITYANAAAEIVLFLDSGSTSDDGDGSNDSVGSVENVIATPHGGDFIRGDSGPNNIDAGAGDNDIIFPLDGNDVVNGGPGVSDGVLYNDIGGGAVTVNLTSGLATGRGNDTLAGFERMNGSNGGNDTLIGNGAANNISGLDGNDTMEGRGGVDDLFGGGGADTASYANAAGPVTAQLGPSAQNGSASIDGDGSTDNLGQVEALTGSENADTLTGNGDARLISALGGNDTLLLRNAGPDFADCGAGTDHATIDATDTSLTACERADGPGATGTPQITGSTPASGSNANSPSIQGTAPGGSTVGLYSSADCSGPPIASGSAADFASAGIAISVADNSTTTLTAKAADNDIDGDSACSGTFDYTEVTPADVPPDTTAPDTSIVKLLKKTKDTTPTYEFRSTEAGSRFECKVDKGNFAACTSPNTLKKLKKGNHTFSVRATDAAGNVDATPAEDKFTVKKKRKRKKK